MATKSLLQANAESLITSASMAATTTTDSLANRQVVSAPPLIYHWTQLESFRWSPPGPTPNSVAPLAASSTSLPSQAPTKLHGSLFHFQRLEALTANDSDGKPLTDFRREQFGGTIGGPIKRDKAFFFFSSENIYEQLTRANLSEPDWANSMSYFCPGDYC